MLFKNSHFRDTGIFLAPSLILQDEGQAYMPQASSYIISCRRAETSVVSVSILPKRLEFSGVPEPLPVFLVSSTFDTAELYPMAHSTKLHKDLPSENRAM